MVKFESIDKEFNTLELEGREMAKLEAQLNNLFGPTDGVIYEILQRYKRQIIDFVKVMKQALNGATFGGQLAEDMEIGLAPVRPAHFVDNGGNSTLGAGVTADGDRFVIDFDTNWKTLAEGTAHDDAGYIVFGLIDLYDGQTYTARVDGVRFSIGQRALLPIDVSPAVLKDNRNEVAIWNFNSIPIVPKDYYKIEVHSPTADATTPPKGAIKLLGFTVGLGRFLKSHF